MLQWLHTCKSKEEYSIWCSSLYDIRKSRSLVTLSYLRINVNLNPDCELPTLFYLLLNPCGLCG